jgi:hypothetical protein
MTQSQSVTGKKLKTCSNRWIISCAPLCATVIRDRLPNAEVDLYALLQCGEDSEYGRKAYDGYIEMFWALLVKDGESSPPVSGNF